MKIYDVIIVGGGPAATIAGYSLGRAGLDVLLIDKCAFPRRKVCGGGLTERAYHQVPFDITPVIHRCIDWGCICFRGREVAAIHGEGPMAYLIDRSSFDAFLLQAAIDQGITFLGNQPVDDLKQVNGQVQVGTKYGDYHSHYLIGADGVHSLVARKCGLIPHRATSLSYEARLSLPPGKADQLIDSMTFDFGALLCGYGWIFPKRDHLNVGVFRSWPGKRATKNQLMRYIARHPALRKVNLEDIRAYPVPLGGKATDLHQGRVLLVGDAANLVDPWLGEGLYYALTSGRMAAETILQCMASQSDDLGDYTRQVNRTLTNQLAYARRLSRLMHAFPYLNVLAFSASRELQGMVIDLLRGTRSYQQIWEDIKTNFPSIIWKMIQNKPSD